MGSQPRAPAAVPRENPGIHCIGDGWVAGSVWTGAENLAPTGIRSPDRPARSEWQYRLSYPGLPCRSSACTVYTGCPTRYRTRHFFNNSNTNEDIATKFEQEYVRCVRNVTTS